MSETKKKYTASIFSSFPGAPSTEIAFLILQRLGIKKDPAEILPWKATGGEGKADETEISRRGERKTKKIDIKPSWTLLRGEKGPNGPNLSM